MRKFAGVLLGAAMSLCIVGAVMAGTIGQNWAVDVSPGWNSPTFDTSATGAVTHRIAFCQSSRSSLYYDLMHHWPLLPSTGTGHQAFTCANTGTWVAHSWTVSAAQYSVEYEKLQNGTTTATFAYLITYP